MSGVCQQLDGLRNLSTAQLRVEWQRVYKEPAPRLGHDLLRRGIAWKLQEQALGSPLTHSLRMTTLTTVCF